MTDALHGPPLRLHASQGFQNAPTALGPQQANEKLAQGQLAGDNQLTHALNGLAKQITKRPDQQHIAQTNAAVDAPTAQGLAARRPILAMARVSMAAARIG